MRRSWLLIATIVMLAGGLRADQINFVGVNGTPYGSSIVGNQYVSPYYGHNNTTNQDLILFCIDFSHNVYFGQTWNATVHQVNQSTFPVPANSFQYGTGPFWSTASTAAPSGSYIPLTALQRYEAAIYLASYGLKYGLFSSEPTRAEVQYAIWELFLQTQAKVTELTGNLAVAGAQYPGANFIANVDQYLSQAVAAVLGGHVTPTLLSQWNVISPYPTGPGSVQEFITPLVNPPDFDIPEAPEPSSVVLLGTVVVGVFLFRRRLLA